MWSRVIGLAIRLSTFDWIMSARMLKNIIIQKNCHRRLYYYINLLISEYPSRDRQSTIIHFNNKTVLFYTTVWFLFTFESMYLKYIKSPQSGQKFEPRISNDMWPHFSDTKLDHTFHVFGYVLFLYFVSYCMWQLSTYVEYGKVLEYTVSWLPIKSNRLQTEYCFLPNT